MGTGERTDPEGERPRCALYPSGCGGDESSYCHGTAFPALCPRSLANTAQNVIPTEAKQLVSAWPLRLIQGGTRYVMGLSFHLPFPPDVLPIRPSH